MKAKFINTVHLEGLLYEHSLALKVSGPTSKNPGTEFITGTIKIATDAQMLNVVEVHYTYVTEKTKTGTSATFTNLKSIIDKNVMTYMEFKGRENYTPAYVRVDTAIGLNDFYTDRNGQEELVSAKRNEGGFLHFIRENELAPDMSRRNCFEADMVVTSIARVEANEENEIPERMRVKGVVFDFRRGILPVEFIIYNPQGMELFENQNPSANNPFCTKVNGTVVSQTVMVRREEESAFGPALVKEYPRSRKEYEIVSIFNQVSYPWDDESFITADELRKAMGDRETYLATVKKNNDEWKAQRAANSTQPSAQAQATVQAKSGGFNF